MYVMMGLARPSCMLSPPLGWPGMLTSSQCSQCLRQGCLALGASGSTMITTSTSTNKQCESGAI